MKKKKNTRKLTFELIYATLMLAPMLAIFSSCSYVALNENAPQTYQTTINYKYKSNEVESESDLIVGNIYNFKYDTYNEEHDFDISFKVINFNSLYVDYETLDNNAEETIFSNILSGQHMYFFNIYTIENGLSFIQYSPTENNYFGNNPFMYGITSILIDFDFICDESITLNNAYTITKSNYNEIESVTTTGYQNVDTFYYAVNQIENQNIFNWSKQSDIYTVINTMNNGIGITNTSLSVLFTYWLYLTISWSIVEIVLVLINKIHEILTSDPYNANPKDINE